MMVTYMILEKGCIIALSFEYQIRNRRHGRHIVYSEGTWLSYLGL